ncbi:MAG: EthD family reductase [Vampirovibrionales bacterium]|nr:EthD family reductase [Vampirovibrionales bacterium]
MTSKLVALYRKPEDVAAFDKTYFEVHLPLANKMPGLMETRVMRLQKNIMGNEPPYYLIAELIFKDEAALKAAMASPEGKAAADNLMGFAGKIVTLLIAEEATSAVVTV